MTLSRFPQPYHLIWKSKWQKWERAKAHPENGRLFKLHGIFFLEDLNLIVEQKMARVDVVLYKLNCHFSLISLTSVSKIMKKYKAKVKLKAWFSNVKEMIKNYMNKNKIITNKSTIQAKEVKVKWKKKQT